MTVSLELLQLQLQLLLLLLLLRLRRRRDFSGMEMVGPGEMEGERHRGEEGWELGLALEVDLVFMRVMESERFVKHMIFLGGRVCMGLW